MCESYFGPAKSGPIKRLTRLNSGPIKRSRLYIYIYTVEPAITATLYNGHLSITNEQSRPKFHNIEPVCSGHLLNAASGHPFVVPD